MTAYRKRSSGQPFTNPGDYSVLPKTIMINWHLVPENKYQCSIKLCSFIADRIYLFKRFDFSSMRTAVGVMDLETEKISGPPLQKQLH